MVNQGFDNIKQNLRQAFWVVVFFSAFINLLMIPLPLYSLQVLDRVLSSHSLETLLMLTIVVGISLVFWAIFSGLRDMIFSGTAKWLDEKISPHLVHQTYDQVTINTKRLPSQNLKDFETIKGFITGPALKAMFDAPWALLFLLILFMIHPFLAYLTIGAGGVLFWIARVSDRNIKIVQKESGDLASAEGYHIDTLHRNSLSIKAMRMGESIKSRWMDNHYKLINKKEFVHKKTAVYGNATKSFRQGIQMFITGLGAVLVLENEMSMGGMIASSILAAKILAPFEVVISSWAQFLAARDSYKNIVDVTAASMANSTKPTLLPEPKGEISFENVFFKFDPASPNQILQGINLKIPAGTVVALIGPSAAGKSTLAALMAGVWRPTMGNVRLDGANVFDMTLPQYGPYVGYLDQNVEFFDGTIRDNIGRMGTNIKDEDVVKAAQLTGNHEYILGFPKGYDTIIGRTGHKLSSGQKQRLALTRAFFGNPKLIILDEPNSNLDEKGDAALLQAVKNAKANKITTIVITHRPAILDVCDKAIVINNGKVIQYEDIKVLQNKIRK